MHFRTVDGGKKEEQTSSQTPPTFETVPASEFFAESSLLFRLGLVQYCVRLDAVECFFEGKSKRETVPRTNLDEEIV